MTNYEHYKKQIEKIVRMGRCVAVEEKTGKVTSCNQITCLQCRFDSCSCDCDTAALAWADDEYIELKVDWYKVAVDTPILVRNSTDEGWSKRHFAKYEKMEFNYLVEKRRMLDSLGRKGCQCDGVECFKCPLSIDNNGSNRICRNFEIEYPAEATEVVRKWADEHPRKTRKDVLFEKFPNAKVCKNGLPFSCCASLGMIPKEQCNENCIECWNMEVKE